MADTWTVVISEEIAEWYLKQSATDQRLVDRMILMLARLGNQLRMPHSRALGEGLFELRFSIQRGTVDQRITYSFDPEKMIITLTTFRKTKQNEQTEVTRARAAKKAHDDEDREEEEDE